MKSTNAQSGRTSGKKPPSPKQKSPFSRTLRILRNIIIGAVARDIAGDGIEELRNQLENAFSDIEVVEENDKPEDIGEG